jgi:hypothetical protein
MCGFLCDYVSSPVLDLLSFVFKREGYGVLSHYCFTSGCVRGNKHTLRVLHQINGLLLEIIQLKRPLFGQNLHIFQIILIELKN